MIFFFFSWSDCGVRREYKGFCTNSSLVSKFRTAMGWERLSSKKCKGRNVISQPKGKKWRNSWWSLFDGGNVTSDKIRSRFWETVKKKKLNKGRQSSKVYCQGAVADVVIRVWGSKKDRRVLWLTEVWLAAMIMQICHWEWKTKEKRMLPKHNRKRKRGLGVREGSEKKKVSHQVSFTSHFPSLLSHFLPWHSMKAALRPVSWVRDMLTAPRVQISICRTQTACWQWRWELHLLSRVASGGITVPFPKRICLG